VLALLVGGLLFQILLMVVIAGFAIGMLIQFGVDDERVPRRCPACGLERMVATDLKDRRFRCSGCNVEVRRERDGRLTPL
jgi:hypothetical protein